MPAEPSIGAVADALSAALPGARAEVDAVRPLVGGARQENFRVEYRRDGEPRRAVLRCDGRPDGLASIDRAAEYRVIRAAVAAGVRTPRVFGFAEGLAGRGGAYFMEWAEGLAIGRKVLKLLAAPAAGEAMARELGAELARVHSVRPDRPPGDAIAALEPLPEGGAEQRALDQARAWLDARREARPALELVLRALEASRPAVEPAVLVHGDFRTGNFLVTERGLSALLDWEFARWGTPWEDLAWISVRDWRFGRLDRPVGGFARREPFYAAYAEEAGRAIDRDAIHWWEVMGNVSWGIGTLLQADRYLSGGSSDLELLALGRRVAEMEWEALRLLDQGPEAL